MLRFVSLGVKYPWRADLHARSFIWRTKKKHTKKGKEGIQKKIIKNE